MEQADMKVLLFVPETDIPRYTCMSNSLFVVGAPEDKVANREISALAIALKEHNKFAIVRLV